MKYIDGAVGSFSFESLQLNSFRWELGLTVGRERGSCCSRVFFKCLGCLLASVRF